MATNYFEGASQNVTDRTKRLLDAVAQGGTEGLRAFENAETGLREADKQAITRAQERARIIGGPEAQGFEALASDQFGRRIADLGANRAGFESDMAARGGAFKDYMSQVGAAVPLVQAKTDQRLAILDQLARQQAAQQAQQDFPIDEIMGLTQMGLPAAQQAATEAEGALEQHRDVVPKWQQGGALQDMANKFKANAAQIDAIDEVIDRGSAGGFKGGLGAIRNLFGAGIKSKDDIEYIAQRKKDLIKEQQDLQNQMDALRVYQAERLKEAPAKREELERAVAEAQGRADPVNLSREIALGMGLPAPLVFGKLTDQKWAPLLNAIEKNDARGISEQAKGLAKSTNLEYGTVEDILSKQHVQETIEEATSEYENRTWEEVQKILADSYLKQGDEDTYRVLNELLRDLPWGLGLEEDE